MIFRSFCLAGPRAIEIEFLNLARDCVATDTERLRCLNSAATGMR
jgi:hypothetical protein